MPYEQINVQQLPLTLQGKIKPYTSYPNYKVLQGEAEDLYCLIFAGPQPNPGYRLIVKQSEIKDDHLYLHVQILPPQRGKMYTQVISYPYIVLKVNSNFNKIIVSGLPKGGRVDR